jgi:hypothetical protein
MTEEAKVILDGKELEVKDFSDQQKYLYNQIVDLKNKQGRLNFETDQINASLSVFENAFKESFKEEPEEEKPRKSNMDILIPLVVISAILLVSIRKFKPELWKKVTAKFKK